MTNSQLISQVTQRANDAKNAGAKVNIQENMPSLSVTLPNGEEYFFQGEEAESMLADVPSIFSHLKEEYFLATSQNW